MSATLVRCFGRADRATIPACSSKIGSASPILTKLHNAAAAAMNPSTIEFLTPMPDTIASVDGVPVVHRSVGSCSHAPHLVNSR